MAIDQQPFSEQLPKRPQSIRESYSQFNSQIGVGQNSLFVGSPADAVFLNWVGNEKPLLYVKDETGKPKQWLSQQDFDQIKKDTVDEEILFDMFSFMVGGRKPTLQEIGATGWTNLLAMVGQSCPPELTEKVKKVFDFLDANPKTTLTESISDFVEITHSRTQEIQTVANGKSHIVILQGYTCYSRDKLFVWHPIRNTRSPIQATSPFKSDGNAIINDVNDIQVGYQTDEKARIVRLNTFVYMLARHGVSEETTTETAADQIYIPLDEYKKQIYPQSEAERKANQQIENENYVIINKLDGYLELQKQKRLSIVNKTIEAAKSGDLDSVMVSIGQFRPKEN